MMNPSCNLVFFLYKMLPLTINKIYYILGILHKMVRSWGASLIEKSGVKSRSIYQKLSGNIKLIKIATWTYILVAKFLKIHLA